MKTIRLATLSIFILLLAGCHQSGIPNLPFLPEPDEPPPDDTVVADSTNVPPTTKAQRIVWLQDNVHPVRSIQPGDVDVSDLQRIGQYIGDSRIVVMGEQTNWDGATQLAKTRLVKYLHETMGFDVLALEAGIYDCAKGWESIRTGSNDGTGFQNASLFVDYIDYLLFVLYPATPLGYGYSEQMQDLIAFIEQEATAQRPLILVGLDCEFTGSYSRDRLYRDLLSYLSDIGIDTKSYAGWSNFVCQVERLANKGFIPGQAEQTEFFEFVGILRSDILEQTFANDPEAAFWIQVIESAETQAKRVWRDWGITAFVCPPYYWNEKSEQMARNLLAYANTIHPDKKIIVWAKNRHVCRRISDEVTNRYGYFSVDGMTSMVDVLWDVMGSDVYAFTFTSLQGTIQPAFSGAYMDVGPVVNGDLEDLMNEAGFELGFLDLRSMGEYRSPETDRVLPENGAWLRDGVIMTTMHYQRMRARDLSRVIDGAFFIRDMTPSTLRTY